MLRAAAWYAAKVRGKFPVVVLTDDLVLGGSGGAQDKTNNLQPTATTSFSHVPPGLEILSAAEYFPRFHGDNPTAMGMYESTRLAREDAAAAAVIASAAEAAAEGQSSAGGGGGIGGGASGQTRSGGGGGGTQLHAQHVPPLLLTEGVSVGELIQGTLRVSKHLPEEAVVRAGSESAAGGGGSGVGVGDVLIPTRTLRNRAFDGDVVVVRLLPRARWVAAKSQALIAADAADEDDEEGEDAKGGVGGEGERSHRGERLVPTGEVVGITRPQGNDFVAVVAEDEAGLLRWFALRV